MNKWSPRAGRNAHYMQFEEYLRRVARIMVADAYTKYLTQAVWQRHMNYIKNVAASAVYHLYARVLVHALKGAGMPHTSGGV